MKLLRWLLPVLSALALPIAGTAPDDPLWQKAVEVARAAESSGPVPGTVSVATRVLKRDGSLDHSGMVVFRTVERTDGDLELEVVRAEQDGKDVTAKAREEEARGRRRTEERRKEGTGDDETLEVSLDYHPFSPKFQERVTAERRGEVLLDGRPAVLFAFRHASSLGKRAVAGRAWLDPATGAPLRVDASPDPLPRFVDTMTPTVFFRLSPEGQWLP